MRALVLVVVLCGCNMSPVQIKRAVEARQSISKKVDEHKQLQEMLRNDLQAFFKDTKIVKYNMELAASTSPGGYEIAIACGNIRSAIESVEVCTNYIKVDGKWIMTDILCKMPNREFVKKIYDPELTEIVKKEMESATDKHRFKVN